jgi:putative DNA methylase
LGFRVQRYGFSKHRDLFAARQLVALITLSDLILEARAKMCSDMRIGGDEVDEPETSSGATPDQYADAIVHFLGEAVSKTSAFHCTLATWRPKDAKSARAFGRQVISMVWDYVEVNPFGQAGGAWEELFESAGKVIESLPTTGGAHVLQRDAMLPVDITNFVISTDPPYYDNAAYAELSDFYYIWLRRAIGPFFPDLFSTLLTPKQEELIANPFRFGNDYTQAKDFFESGLAKAFVQMLSAQNVEVPLTVYYAVKQTEDDGEGDENDESQQALASTGWETMLQGLIGAGFMVIGTWPMRTESVIGLKTIRNALASSIVLVCRPRLSDAPLATRKEFMTALRHELPEALKNLQHGNIAPVDLAQAAIGPGMAVFTRFRKVIETDGSPMSVRTALGLINQALDEILAEQEGEFDAPTRWAIAWFEQHGMDEGPFGVAEVLSKAKNTGVNRLIEAGIARSRAGKVRLVPRGGLRDDWAPVPGHVTVWDATQHLIRALDTRGESGAAALLRQLGGTAEVARDLAYRLYTVCERKKWAEEARAYNGLVVAWPELVKLALAEQTRQTSTQEELF